MQAMKVIRSIIVIAALAALLVVVSASNPFADQGPGGRPMGDPQQAKSIPAGPYVYELSLQEMKDGALSDGRLWFVEYYVPWCR